MNVFLPAAVSFLIRAIPAHLMAYFPFRDRLRQPLWKVLLPVSLLQLVQALLYGYVALRGGSGVWVSYGFALVYMAIYFSNVRDDRFKVLFLYLFVMDYVMILWGISAFLEARFFYRPDTDFNSWTSAVLNLIVLAVSAPFTLSFFSSAREKVFSSDAPVFWRTAWMVPAFTTAIVVIFTANFDAGEARTFRFLFARVLLLLCGLVVYSLLLDALDSIRCQAALAEQAAMQEQLLNLQRMQHKQMLKHMEEVREARHDMRQHLGVLNAFLEKGDIAGMRAYLEAYAGKLPTDASRTYTRNFALNAVCVYYAEEARKHHIRCDIVLDMPERLPMSEPEVCALLGNLLENAVEACRAVDCTDPFIRVRGIHEENHIVLAVDNSCSQEPKWENGRLLSSKHGGFGIGTRAVRETAERSGGAAEFFCRDGIFYASVFLYG